MKYRILFPAIFVSLAALGQVDQDMAARVAENFFLQQTGATGKLLPATDNRLSEYPWLHFFNKDGGGWIILSKSIRSRPVVAFSSRGSLDGIEKIPPPLEMWLENYHRQTGFLESAGIPATGEIQSEWESLRAGGIASGKSRSARQVEPMLRSDWDQDKYYNEYCPADPGGPGGHCPAGCVATAMGQVMNYFRWPQTGAGSYSYECLPYGTLFADFENTAYQWSRMEPSIDHPNPDIAQVLSHLGISVDMVYTPQSSGMYNHKAAYSLRTFFKYLPSTEYVFRDSTTMDWDSLIVSHLDRDIPLYYAGWSVPNINGHAFVCDGYLDTGYYHFNFGWNGLGNGYFYTDNLNPLGNNFNLAQEVIINAVPDTINYQYPAYCQDTARLTSTWGTIEDGSGPLHGYQESAECHWLIDPEDSVNFVTFELLRLDLASGDTLFIYDGQDGSASLLGAFTGVTLPPPVNSTGTALFVRFTSDGDSCSDGWLASFYGDIPEYCAGMVTLTGLTDTISDGSGNFNYQNNTSCLWMIEPEPAESVTLFFNYFETEEAIDHVGIYDKVTQELLAEYSGNYPNDPPAPVTSESGKMLVVFQTNYTVRADGWEAYYLTDYVGTGRENRPAGDLRIVPVPASGSVRIIAPGNFDFPVSLNIYSISGRKIMGAKISGHSSSIDVSGLSPGIYLVEFKSPAYLKSEKLIISR